MAVLLKLLLKNTHNIAIFLDTITSHANTY